MDAVILAGGKGTRLGLTDIPKPMVDFDGIPLLHRQLNILNQTRQINKVYVLSGHLGEVIIEYFSTISFDSIELIHIKEEEPKGTAGALKQLSSFVSDRFLVLYGDTFFDIDIERFINYDQELNCDYGTLFIHPNDHPYDSDLVVIEDKRIQKVLPKPHDPDLKPRNYANAAFYILSKSIFELPLEFNQKDLGRDIFPTISPNGLGSYLSSEYIKDIGTPKRLDAALERYRKGATSSKNLSRPQKALFLDRDGVINYEKEPYINLINFEIYPDLADFLLEARAKGFLLFVVTNQPLIAKGFISFEELDTIHQKLESSLLEQGVFFDEIKFCPHHPESGHEGEVSELKIQCSCRKPNTQMVEELIAHYHIDRIKSIVIGDRYTDIQTGVNAGLKTLLLERGLNGNDHSKFPNCIPDFTFKNLVEAKQILL